MIFLAFAFGIMTLVLTFQVVPPDLKLPFFLMCALLPLLAIVVMLLKDITISRALPLYVLPGALIFCVLLRLTYQPLFEMNPDRAFSSFLTRQVRYSPDLQILSWVQNDKSLALKYCSNAAKSNGHAGIGDSNAAGAGGYHYSRIPVL